MRDRGAPGRQIEAAEHLGRQREFLARRPTLVALGRQRQRERGIPQRRFQVKADVAAAELVAGQRRGQHQQRRRIGHLAHQEAGEGLVERPEPLAVDPALEQRERGGRVAQRGRSRNSGAAQRGRTQASGAAQGRVERGRCAGARSAGNGDRRPHAASLAVTRENRRSSASISDLGGRSACTPWLGASAPRRYR